jgi:hypothetical protein
MQRTGSGMNAIELLQQAKVRIERGWTQGWFARDSNGSRVEIGSDRATCFCISGAIYNKGTDILELVKARYFLSRVLPRRFDNIVEFNDNESTTKEDVINLLDKAIEYGKLSQ